MYLQGQGKLMLVTLGIFFVLVFTGIYISLDRYNWQVASEPPLQFANWQLSRGEMKISLLGTIISLKLDTELPGRTKTQLITLLGQGQVKAATWLEFVKQKEQKMRNWLKASFFVCGHNGAFDNPDKIYLTSG